jgi:hypothetical protein
MLAVSDRIMKRVRGKGRGWVFTPKHFVDFGTRGAIDVALSRLAKAGEIRRIGRGLYDYPRLHATLGALSPETNRLADAISAQAGDRFAPSGAMAANSLGLSTQVPAKASYATNGPTRIKRAAGRSLTLRHSRAPILENASASANAIVQALAHLGQGQVDADAIRKFANQVDDRDMHALLRARSRMSGWMSDAVLKIQEARHG